jgi:branched-chain amino acid transport system substrate-binding protein
VDQGVTQNNAGGLVRDLRAGAPDAAFMGPDGIYETNFIRAAGPAAGGAFVTFGGVPARLLEGEGAGWRERYRNWYGEEPEPFAAYAYEAAKVTLAAIRLVGSADRRAIRDVALTTSGFPGILGSWSFDGNGDTTLTTASGRRVVDGQFDEANAVRITAGRAR